MIYIIPLFGLIYRCLTFFHLADAISESIMGTQKLLIQSDFSFSQNALYSFLKTLLSFRDISNSLIMMFSKSSAADSLNVEIVSGMFNSLYIIPLQLLCISMFFLQKYQVLSGTSTVDGIWKNIMAKGEIPHYEQFLH